MNPNKVSAPAGARPNDFDGLSDWTVTDIATAPKTSPEDRANADMEIARRKKLGTFTLEQTRKGDVRDELLANGYGVSNGKLLYPTEEYREWLNSDRSGERPKGVVRESLQERVNKEKQEAETMAYYDDESANFAPFEEPSEPAPARTLRHSVESKIERKTDLKMKQERARREGKKDEAIHAIATSHMSKPNTIPVHPVERDEAPEKNPQSEADKYYNKYDKNFMKKLDEQRFAKEIRAQNERKNKAATRGEELNERNLETVNIYKNSIATKWIAAGVASYIARGDVFNITDKEASILEHEDTAQAKMAELQASREKIMSNVLRAGFYAHEGDRIRDNIEMSGLSDESMSAASGLKAKVSEQLIPSKVPEVLEQPALISDAKRRGALYAIKTGARYDSLHHKISYSINADYGTDIAMFMHKECDINFGENLEAGYQGFANIIEAIKHIRPLTKINENGEVVRANIPHKNHVPEGFKELDWYFENFKFGKNIEAFDNAMTEFAESSEDNKWADKLDEYRAYRKELLAAEGEKRKQNVLPTVDPNTLTPIKDIDKLDLEDLEKLAKIMLFGDDPTSPARNGNGGNNGGNNGGKNINKPILSKARFEEFKINSAKLKKYDSELNVYAGLFVDSKHHRHFYLMNELTKGNMPVFTASPIVDNAFNAAYCWVGDYGENKADWQNFFIASNKNKNIANKREMYRNPQIKIHTHIQGNGRNPVQNMWYNMLLDIDRRTNVIRVSNKGNKSGKGKKAKVI